MWRRNAARLHQLLGQQLQHDAVWAERVLSNSTAGPSSSLAQLQATRWIHGLRTSLPARCSGHGMGMHTPVPQVRSRLVPLHPPLQALLMRAMICTIAFQNRCACVHRACVCMAGSSGVLSPPPMAVAVRRVRHVAACSAHRACLAGLLACRHSGMCMRMAPRHRWRCTCRRMWRRMRPHVIATHVLMPHHEHASQIAHINSAHTWLHI